MKCLINVFSYSCLLRTATAPASYRGPQYYPGPGYGKGTVPADHILHLSIPRRRLLKECSLVAVARRPLVSLCLVIRFCTLLICTAVIVVTSDWIGIVSVLQQTVGRLDVGYRHFRVHSFKHCVHIYCLNPNRS